jgi:hypothetical protein
MAAARGPVLGLVRWSGEAFVMMCIDRSGLFYVLLHQMVIGVFLGAVLFAIAVFFVRVGKAVSV